MSTKSKPYLFSLFLGNFLSHYDIALFWVLSPFLAPLLFPSQSVIEGLTLFYLIIPMSKWARPLGAWVLGKLSVRIGAHKTLVLSLSGLAASCLGMVFCPTGNPVISFAWVASCRMIMCFFSASETSAASWLILQHQKDKKGFMSGLIGSTNLMGYCVAAFLVALIAGVGSVEASWRWFYISGVVAGIIALFLRLVFKEAGPLAPYLSILKQNPDPLIPKSKPKGLQKRIIAKIALATCFSYGTYEVPMTVAYTAVTVIAAIEKTHLLWLNLGLLVFDALLLPWFGQLADRFGREKVMGAAALVWALCSGFFLDLLHGASFIEVTLVRVFLVFIGVIFAAPYYSWVNSLLPPKTEILHLSLGNSIGKYVGGFIPAAIFFLYQKFDSFLIASIPLSLVSLATAILLLKKVFSEGRAPKHKDAAIEQI